MKCESRLIILIEKNLLYELYFNQEKTHREIAEELNVSTSMVSRYFVEYGFKSPKVWTKEEINFLEEKYGILSFEAIGKRLGRSAQAVHAKSKRIGLGGVLNISDELTAKELARVLAVDNKTITRWREKHGLKARFKKIGMKGYYWRIKLSDFWKWAEEHQEMIKWSKVEVNILGKEPKWVKEVRQSDAARPKKQAQNWTSSEDGYLRMYWDIGKTAKEIAALLNRTIPGVRKRISKLGLDHKVIAISWKPEEINILKEMKIQGYTDNQVAEELGRDISSVSWKRKKLIKSGELNWSYRG